MRRDHQILPFAQVNPDYDLDATALVLTYCIGDDRDPDEVIDVRANGDFRIDDTLRAEIRAILLDSADDLSADDLDVQETQIVPMGTGLAYQFELWLQALPPNIVAGLIVAGILTGCDRLKTRFRRPVSPTASTNTFALPPEQQLVGYAKILIAEHYAVQGDDLTSLNVEITESPSVLKFSGTADFSEAGGRAFHVIVDYDAHSWKQIRIVRKHPKR